MENQNSLVYLPAALEALRLLTSLTERYADGEMTDEEFKSGWQKTALENESADAAWFASVETQAVS